MLASLLAGLCCLVPACQHEEPAGRDASSDNAEGDAGPEDGDTSANDPFATDAAGGAGENADMDAGSPEAGPAQDAAVPRDAGPTPFDPCDADALGLTPVPSNVMLAVELELLRAEDKKGRLTALQPLLTEPSVNLGGHVYSALQNGLDASLSEVNFCGQPVHKVQPISSDGGQAVLNLIALQRPQNQYFNFRPLLAGLGHYLERTDLFPQGAEAAKYLVVLTQGGDNCFGTTYRPDAIVEAALERMAIELKRHDIRLVVVAVLPPDAATLRALTKAESSGWLEKVYDAHDAGALPAAIADVAERVRACRYKAAHPSVARLSVDGVPLERDRTRRAGWDAIDPAQGVVEVFGDACKAVQRGAVVSAQPACPVAPPCASRRLALQAAPRSIRFLVSAGASMSTCTVGDDVDCATGAALSWSGVVARAVAGALENPAYDDYAFGLHTYPSQRGDGCWVSSAPDVLEDTGTELAILRGLSYPASGSSPLLQALEAIASKPGKLLASPAASGLIVIGNGNNNCGEVSQSDALQRLMAAVSKLAAAGIQVVPVRTGPRTDEGQDAIMGAVGSSSNLSGLPTEAGVPYLDAVDPAALPPLLDQVLRRFGGCSVQLTEPVAEAEASRLRLYLGGALVPFDSASAKAEGWGFSEPSRQALEFYGTACERFRKTSIDAVTLELGC